jgi:hypothetical protein
VITAAAPGQGVEFIAVFESDQMGHGRIFGLMENGETPVEKLL